MPDPIDFPLRVMQLVNGYQVTQALHVAVTLRIPDRVGGGARSSDELAEATGTNAAALYRLLRALAAIGVFEERPGRCFAATPISELLRLDRPFSFGGYAAYVGRACNFAAWAQLLESVRTGETGYATLGHGSLWQHHAAHPEDHASFDAAMTSLSRLQTGLLLRAYDFGRFRRIADIGGGRGALLAGILEKHPACEGVLLDQPQVVAGAEENLRAAGVAERCRVVAGSFFDAAPVADAYVLKSILHDWYDAPASEILRAIRKAAPAHARLLVIEQLVGPPNEGAPAKWMDLAMLVSAGGRERTREEFAELFASAGFSLTAVHPAGPVNVIEGALA